MIMTNQLPHSIYIRRIRYIPTLAQDWVTSRVGGSNRVLMAVHYGPAVNTLHVSSVEQLTLYFKDTTCISTAI